MVDAFFSAGASFPSRPRRAETHVDVEDDVGEEAAAVRGRDSHLEHVGRQAPKQFLPFDKNFGSVMLIRSDDPEDSDSDDELLPDNIPDKMVDNAITAAALYNNKIGYFPNLNNC